MFEFSSGTIYMLTKTDGKPLLSSSDISNKPFWVNQPVYLYHWCESVRLSLKPCQTSAFYSTSSPLRNRPYPRLFPGFHSGNSIVTPREIPSGSTVLQAGYIPSPGP